VADVLAQQVVEVETGRRRVVGEHEVVAGEVALEGDPRTPHRLQRQQTQGDPPDCGGVPVPEGALVFAPSRFRPFRRVLSRRRCGLLARRHLCILPAQRHIEVQTSRRATPGKAPFGVSPDLGVQRATRW
jgi:hypothetical protein